MTDDYSEQTLFGDNSASNISSIPEYIETTNKSTAKSSSRYSWIKYRASRNIDNERTWVFVDGSSTGWHAAVIVIPGIGERCVASFVEKTDMRNVSSELDSLILGLSHSPVGRNIVIVHDYIGIGAWMIGAWKMRRDGIRSRIDNAKKILNERKLKVKFIHHSGHQKDKSDFTRWNNKADGLCSDSVFVDRFREWDEVLNN